MAIPSVYTSEEGKIWQEFEAAKQKRQLKDVIWAELDAFDRGEQWELGGKLPSWIPKPVTNYVHLVKTTKRAALAGENMVGRLRAINPLDTIRIDKLNKVYQHEWKITRMRKLVRDCLETSRLLGTGIAHLYYDANTGVLGTEGARFEGMIRGCQIDPAQFYPDPSAFRLRDCTYVHVVERRNIEWLKKHPKFKEAMKNIQVVERSSDSTDGEIYQRGALAVERDGMVDFRSHYRKKQNPEGGYYIEVTYLAGRRVIGKAERLKISTYPFAILYDYEQRMDFWAKSICELILENQKLINKVESIIAMIGVLMQNPQKVVNKNSGIDPRELAKFAMAPGHTYVSNIDATKAVHFIVPPQIPQQLFNLAEQAKQNIREITGLNEAYLGKNVGSLQTSGGVNSLIERATLRDQDQMYDVELFIEDISRIQLELMAEMYDQERFINIAGKGEKDNFLAYTGAEFKGLDFTFENDISQKAPISRARRKEEAQNLLNIQGQYGFTPAVITPQEFVRSQDMIDAEIILDRMEKEELRDTLQETLQVATMMSEAIQSGVPEQEVQQMAIAMIQQIENKGKDGIGSASIQNQQQGVPSL